MSLPLAGSSGSYMAPTVAPPAVDLALKHPGSGGAGGGLAGPTNGLLLDRMHSHYYASSTAGSANGPLPHGYGAPGNGPAAPAPFWQRRATAREAAEAAVSAFKAAEQALHEQQALVVRVKTLQALQQPRWQYLDDDDVIRGPFSLMQLIDGELRGRWDNLIEDVERGQYASLRDAAAATPFKAAWENLHEARTRRTEAERELAARLLEVRRMRPAGGGRVLVAGAL